MSLGNHTSEGTGTPSPDPFPLLIGWYVDMMAGEGAVCSAWPSDPIEGIWGSEIMKRP